MKSCVDRVRIGEKRNADRGPTIDPTGSFKKDHIIAILQYPLSMLVV